MTLDTDNRIETGRSWRDLPEEPPFGDPLDLIWLTVLAPKPEPEKAAKPAAKMP